MPHLTGPTAFEISSCGFDRIYGVQLTSLGDLLPVFIKIDKKFLAAGTGVFLWKQKHSRIIEVGCIL